MPKKIRTLIRELEKAGFLNRGGSHDPNTNGSGLYWPGGVDAIKAAVFEEGLLWGGYVKDSIQVNGNTFRQ